MDIIEKQGREIISLQKKSSKAPNSRQSENRASDFWKEGNSKEFYGASIVAGGQDDTKKKGGPGHSLNRKESKLPPSTNQAGVKKPAKKGDDLWVSKEAEHL